jgi:hypothetical protein
MFVVHIKQEERAYTSCTSISECTLNHVIAVVSPSGSLCVPFRGTPRPQVGMDSCSPARCTECLWNACKAVRSCSVPTEMRVVNSIMHLLDAQTSWHKRTEHACLPSKSLSGPPIMGAEYEHTSPGGRMIKHGTSGVVLGDGYACTSPLA